MSIFDAQSWRHGLVALAAIVFCAALPTAAGAALPDGRAYEMVSPADKAGGDIGSISVAGYNAEQGMQASTGSGAIIYHASSRFANTASGAPTVSYRATRAADGTWTTVPILPVTGSGLGVFQQAPFAASDDLSTVLYGDFQALTTSQAFAAPNNLYSVGPQGTVLLSPGEPNDFLDAGPWFDGGNSSLSRVVYSDGAALTPSATQISPPLARDGNIYGWEDGQLRQVGILPNDTPANGAVVGSDVALGTMNHAVSDDADRVFFTSLDDQQLYLRDDAFGAAPSTELISGTAGGPDATGAYPATFVGASADGATAYFTSAGELTPDANTGSSRTGRDMYVYSAGGGLADITVDTNAGDADGANVQGIAGLSDDGSTVYFVALGQLDGTLGVAGSPNLYVYQAGHGVRYVTTLSTATDTGVWDASQGVRPVEVTPSGLVLVFSAASNLTTYDSGGRSEVYVYRLGGSVSCASCPPDGAPASGNALLPPHEGLGGGSGPAAPLGRHQPLFVSADGTKVFFNSPDALLPQDTNGRYDVYEWSGGSARLISSGRSDDDALFVDSTPDASDVYFLSREQLSGADDDSNLDLYDARVGGITAARPVLADPCSGEDCRPSPARAPAAPASATLHADGGGNVPAPPPAATPAARVSIAGKSGSHGRVVLSVSVSRAGRLTVSGRGLRTVRKSVAKRGTYRLTVSLTAAARSRLRRHRRVAVRPRVGFSATGAKPRSVSTSLTVKL